MTRPDHDIMDMMVLESGGVGMVLRELESGERDTAVETLREADWSY
jgi:hypothetical protein